MLNKLSKNYNEKSCSGRSLLEMLIVLSIAGILLVGLVLGISYAKDKATANGVLKEAMAQAAEIKARARQYTYTDENGQEQIKFPRADQSQFISFRAYGDENKTLILKAFNVSKGVCSKLVSESGASIFSTIYVDANNTKSIDCLAEQNTVVFETEVVAVAGERMKPGIIELCPSTKTVNTCDENKKREVNARGCILVNYAYQACDVGQKCIGDVCVSNSCPDTIVERCDITEDVYNSDNCLIERAKPCELPWMCNSVDQTCVCSKTCNADVGFERDDALCSCVCKDGYKYYKKNGNELCCRKDLWAEKEQECCNPSKGEKVVDGVCCSSNVVINGVCCPVPEVRKACSADQTDVIDKNGCLITKYEYKECSDGDVCVSGVCCPEKIQKTSCDVNLPSSLYDEKGCVLEEYVHQPCPKGETCINGTCVPEECPKDFKTRCDITEDVYNSDACLVEKSNICTEPWSCDIETQSCVCPKVCDANAFFALNEETCSCVCQSGYQLYENQNGQSACCPLGSWIEGKNGSAGKCCNPETEKVVFGECCALDRFAEAENDGKGTCCSDGMVVVSGHCCPTGSVWVDGVGCIACSSDAQVYCAEQDVDGNCISYQCCDHELSNGYCCPEGTVYNENTRTCVTCILGTNEGCGDEGICLCKSYSDTKCCLFCSGETYCVPKKPLSSLKNVQGRYNASLLYIYPELVTYDNAAYICKAYGMHMPSIQEACGKDNSGDSGHACPNLQGQFPEYHSSGRGGDVWLGEIPSKGTCQALQVTNSCGNNHYTSTCSFRYAICTYGGMCSAEDEDCLTCADVTKDQYKASRENCKACGENTRFFREDGYCLKCDNKDNQKNVTAEECGRCTNRFWQMTDAAKGLGTCRLCPGGTERNETKTSCENYCGFNQVMLLNNKTCSKCPTGNGSIAETDLTQCLSCGSMLWRNSDDRCYSCSNTNIIANTTREECGRCDNRYWDLKNATNGFGNCILCPNNSKASEDGLYCEVCDEGLIFATDKKCKACPTTSYFDASENQCMLCPSATWRSNDEKCLGCTYTGNMVNMTKEECGRCDNRYWIPGSNGLGTCVLCPNGGKASEDGLYCEVCEEGSIFATDKKCRACPAGNTYFKSIENQCLTCPSVFWRSKDQNCFNCAYSGDIGNTTKEECGRCDSRYWIPVSNGLGTCKVCPNGSKASEDGLSCQSCSGGQIFANAGTCKACPAGNTYFQSSKNQCLTCSSVTWRSKDQNCFNCSYSGDLANTTKEECVSCGIRYWVAGSNGLGTCKLCPNGSKVSEDGLSCMLCEEGQVFNSSKKCVACPASTTTVAAVESQCLSCPSVTWRSNDGKCINCAHTSDLTSMTKEECVRCDNRYWVAGSNGLGTCILCPNGAKASADGLYCESCSSGNFYALNKKCYSCDGQKASFYIAADKSSCGTCAKNTVFWREANKYCMDCDITTVQNTTKEECDRCPNRYWKLKKEGNIKEGSPECKLCPDGLKASSDGQGCVCPTGHYWSYEDGKCYSCRENVTRYGIRKQDCEVCKELRQWSTAAFLGTCSFSDSLTCPIGKYLNAQQYCVDCPSGYWCQSIEPTACEAGTYNALEGQSSITACKVCPEGYYTDKAGSTACTICPTGSYCTGGNKFACPAGTYTDEEGQSSCIMPENGWFVETIKTCVGGACKKTICPLGSYCTLGLKHTCEDGTYADETGLGACKETSPGYYVDKKTTVPKTCPKGSYCINGIKTTCPAGRYADETGLSACKVPQTGYYANTTSTQAICTANYYCVDGIRTKCPTGSTSAKGSTECAAKNDTCPAGQYATSATACKVCEKGYYCENSVRTACPAGRYADETGLSACKVPQTGYYASSTSAQALCTKGYYCVDGIRTKCPKGTYAATTGLTVCTDASAGYYVASEGQSAQKACAAGKYNPLTKQTAATSCLACEAGTYSAAGSAKCKNADPGYYVEGTGKTAQTACAAGTYNPNAKQTSKSVCLKCDAGTYSVAGSATCKDADAGYYVTGTGQSKQTACDAGTYNSLKKQTAKTACLACPAETYAPAGSAKCKKADAGYYVSSASAQSACPKGNYCINGVKTACPAGKYADVTGLSACKVPQAGYYASSTSVQSACPKGSYCVGGVKTTCPAGRYADVTGLSACKVPQTGYYANTTSTQTICPVNNYCVDGIKTACPTGSTSEKGATKCTAKNNTCPAGQYGSSATACKVCEKGYYCVGGVKTACPAGRYADVTGLSACKVPQDGYYASSTSAQTICPKGTYCVDGIKTNCPAGRYADTTGLTACKVPQTGHYASSTTAQTICPTGSYCVDGIKTACPSGMYAHTTGLTSCRAAQTGYYVSSDKTKEVQCEAGSYCVAGIKTACPIGTYADEIGSTSCKDADPGYYVDGTGKKAQTACGAGKYNPYSKQVKSAACSACPKGTYSLAGSASCTDAAPGYYVASEGQSKQTACPKATYNPKSKQTAKSACIACPTGQYAAEGSASCNVPKAGYYVTTTYPFYAVCPAGSYCVAGIKTACPKGTYTDKEQQTTCQPCPKGTYASKKGLKACTPVKSGYKGVDADGYCTDIGAVGQSTTCK